MKIDYGERKKLPSGFAKVTYQSGFHGSVDLYPWHPPSSSSASNGAISVDRSFESK